MAFRINQTTLTTVLRKIFEQYTGASVSPITRLYLSKAVLPATPTTTIAAADQLDNGAMTINYSNFSTPAESKFQLLNVFPITIKAAVTNQVPTFIRLSNSSGLNSGIIDLDVSNTAGSNRAVINTLSVSTGSSVQINELKAQLNNNTGCIISPIIYNSIWRSLLGFPQAYGPDDNLMFGFSGLVNPDTWAEEANTTTISAYTGSIPTTLGAPTGTLLWSYELDYNIAETLFTVSSNRASSKALTANAIANGTPTYIRIRRAAQTVGSITYPEIIIQLTVSSNVNFVNAVMTAGQSNTLEPFDLMFG